jgi:hypothetical protein
MYNYRQRQQSKAVQIGVSLRHQHVLSSSLFALSPGERPKFRSINLASRMKQSVLSETYQQLQKRRGICILYEVPVHLF